VGSIPTRFRQYPRLRYSADTVRNSDGDSIGIDPDRQGSFDANAYVAGLWWVSDRKILGANYGFLVFASLTDNSLEIPILQLERKTDTGFTDLCFQPINLGWHTSRADLRPGSGSSRPPASMNLAVRTTWGWACGASSPSPDTLR
jgi:hypothetical protein